jgi:hypothetical protein
LGGSVLVFRFSRTCRKPTSLRRSGSQSR